MDLKCPSTADQYRAELFEQLLDDHTITRDRLAHLWELVREDVSAAQRFHDALFSNKFHQPTDLLRTGYPQSDISKAHMVALRTIGESVDLIAKLVSEYEIREAEQRAAMIAEREERMEQLFNGLPPDSQPNAEPARSDQPLTGEQNAIQG